MLKNAPPKTPGYVLELTEGQAQAVSYGLDAYTRLCIGQLDTVTELVRDGTIPMANPHSGAARQLADYDTIERIDYLIKQIKRELGYSASGSHGIGHHDVHITGHRAYEIKKVLAREIALARNPTPDFKTVDYDGLGPRYTTDPAPVARRKVGA